MEIKFILRERHSATKKSRETSKMVPEDLPREKVLLNVGYTRGGHDGAKSDHGNGRED